jgi:hypothetical protein
VEIYLKKTLHVKKGLTAALFMIIVITVLSWIGQGFNTVSAAETIPISGTWNGVISGTTPVKSSSLKIEFQATVSGTFDGDTSIGDWKGELDSNYTVTPVGVEGEDKGDVLGGYTITVDDSGTISGGGVTEISGVLTGTLQFDIQGELSESGEISGTWTGTLTSETLNYGGTPVAIDANFDASGEFKGEAVPKETPTTPSPTTPSPTTTTPTTIPTTTSTPTPTATPISEPEPSNQYLTYAIIGIIAIIIVIGVYIFRIRRVNTE